MFALHSWSEISFIRQSTRCVFAPALSWVILLKCSYFVGLVRLTRTYLTHPHLRLNKLLKDSKTPSHTLFMTTLQQRIYEETGHDSVRVRRAQESSVADVK